MAGGVYLLNCNILAEVPEMTPDKGTCTFEIGDGLTPLPETIRFAHLGKKIRTVVGPVKQVETALEEVDTLAEMAAEGDEEEVLSEVSGLVDQMREIVERLEFQVMLGGPNDQAGAFMQISAGAGGIDHANTGDSISPPDGTGGDDRPDLRSSGLLRLLRRARHRALRPTWSS